MKKPYKTIKTYYRNKHADVYYREALYKETKKYLEAIIKDLEDNYATMYVNNGWRGSVDKLARLFKKYKGKYFETYLGNSRKIIEKWLKLATKGSVSNIKKQFEQLGLKAKINYTLQGTKFDDILKIIIERNVGLIQNTTMQSLNNLENIVYDGVTTGINLKGMENDINKQYHISYDRIKRIARDQTAKANTALDILTQRSAGVEFFEWDTAQDERVSTGFGGHKQLQGKIYRWDEPEHYPIIDSYGHTGLPSQRVNCRCKAQPVILIDDYKAILQKDGSYKLVTVNTKVQNWIPKDRIRDWTTIHGAKVPQYYTVYLATEQMKEGQSPDLLNLYNVKVIKKEPQDENLISAPEAP